MLKAFAANAHCTESAAAQGKQPLIDSPAGAPERSGRLATEVMTAKVEAGIGGIGTHGERPLLALHCFRLLPACRRADPRRLPRAPRETLTLRRAFTDRRRPPVPAARRPRQLPPEDRNRDGSTHVVLDPLTFPERLCAFVPRPCATASCRHRCLRMTMAARVPAAQGCAQSSAQS